MFDISSKHRLTVRANVFHSEPSFVFISFPTVDIFVPSSNSMPPWAETTNGLRYYWLPRRKSALAYRKWNKSI